MEKDKDKKNNKSKKTKDKNTNKNTSTHAQAATMVAGAPVAGVPCFVGYIRRNLSSTVL